MADSPCESWVYSTIGFHHNPEREGEMADSPCESWVSSTIGFHHNPEREGEMADSPCESWVSSTIGFHHNPEREGEMADSPCESWVSSTIGFHHNPEDETLESQTQSTAAGILNQDEEWAKLNVSNKKNKKSQVLLEGYVETADEDDLTRTKSLTDEDLDELKGCLDLGFGFSYDEIPELCNTLPALELCYSMSQKFMDEQQKLPENAEAAATDSSSVASPIANWRISSPGDHPEDVKARLKFWAQAVACTVKLCS